MDNGESLFGGDLLFGENRRSRELEQAQERRDLAEVLAAPAGFRFLARLLKELGLGNYASCDTGSIALLNEGEALLRQIIEADSGNALRLIAAIRGIEL